jgi:FkbM family methyltransferase
MLLRRWGIDLCRYDVSQSTDARLQALFLSHEIDTVVDVGANDGGYASEVLNSGFKGNVISFEPQAAAHHSLIKKLSKFPNWAAAPCMALGEHDGTIELNIAENSVSSSVLPMLDAHLKSAPESRYIRTEKVPVRRLDSVDHPILKQARSLHLKVDTQGYEMPVLLGAKDLMPQVRGLQLEMSIVPLYSGQMLFREMYDWVVKQDFQLMNIVPGFSDLKTGQLLQMDAIFFKE